MYPQYPRTLDKTIDCSEHLPNRLLLLEEYGIFLKRLPDGIAINRTNLHIRRTTNDSDIENFCILQLRSLL